MDCYNTNKSLDSRLLFVVCLQNEIGLLGSDLIHSGSAIRTSRFHGRFTIFHGNVLRIRYFFFRFTFYAIHLCHAQLTSSQIRLLGKKPILHRTKIDNDFKRNDSCDNDGAFAHVMTKVCYFSIMRRRLRAFLRGMTLFCELFLFFRFTCHSPVAEISCMNNSPSCLIVTIYPRRMQCKRD